MAYQKTGRRMGEAHHNAKLTVEQVVEIYLSREKQEYLASIYKVRQGTINSIKTGKRWKHLTSKLEKDG